MIKKIIRKYVSLIIKIIVIMPVCCVFNLDLTHICYNIFGLIYFWLLSNYYVKATRYMRKLISMFN